MAKLNSSRIYGNLIVDNTITGNGSGLTALNASNISSGTLAVARGGTGATDATGARTNLGATTLGANLFTLTNVSAISFLRVNANNTVDRLSAADFRTAIGAGTGNGTVTGVTGTSPIVSSGGTAPAISHANSGVSAGTYNNVTVNVTGHVTAGSNVGYLTAHPTITVTTDTTSTASPAFGGTFTAIDSVTRDANGHVTTLNTKTVTLPANPNTDTNTTYDLTVPESTTAIRLAGSDSTNDDITLTAGTNVTITRNSATQLTIASSFTDTNTASAVNNILKGSNSGTAITYAPYLVAEKAAGRIYEGTTNPTNATRVNYDGNFHATQLFEGGTRVLTAHPSVSAAASSDNSGRTYIQDILLDSFGHVTGIATATETVVDTNTATAVNNILAGSNSGTAITYAPYSTDLSANVAPRLYTTTNVPTGTSRLNLSSYFWATRLHSLGIYGGDLSGGNLTIGSTSNATKGTITLDSDTVISGNLTINGTTTTINSTQKTLDDPILTLGGDTSTVEITKDRGIEAKYNGTTLTITNYIGNATTTVTGTVASTAGFAAGDIITISGATGTEQTKLNGTWKIASVPNATTFTFVVATAVASGTLSTTLGTTVKSRNAFFGLDQSSGYFTFIPQGNNTSEVFSGTQGDIQVSNFRGNLIGGTVSATTGVFSSTLSATTLTLSSTSPTLTTTASGAKTANFISNVINATATSSTASITKTGLDVQSTGTWNGTSAVNRALLLNATGGTINRALEVTAGTSILQDTTATTLTLSSTSPTLTTTASGAKTANFASNTINATATSSTASITKTGLDIQSTGTWNGTTAVNRALLLNATGGTINRAIQVEAGTSVLQDITATTGTFSSTLSATAPRFTTSVNDVNGNEVFTIGATASAVNELSITNAATANAVTLSTSGGDTNIGLNINTKGTGSITLGNATNINSNLGIRAAATTSTSTQIPVFIADPTSTTRTLVTRTPAQLRSDIGAQAAGSYLTAHPTITVTADTTSTASPAFGGTFTAIDGVTRDANGHVTTLNTKTVTLPANPNTDTLNTAGSNQSTSKLFLVGPTSQTTGSSGLQTFSNSTVYTTNGTLFAPTFAGGEASGGNLTIRSTSNATKGTITLDSNTSVSGNITLSGTIIKDVAVGTDADILSGTIGTNDFYRIRAGGASNAGYLEIATADDASEPIHFRQYTGVFTTLTRTATILDGSGNTSLPGSLTVGGNISLTNASSVSTSTGALTLSTAAGNGNVILTPHGTGITTTARPLTITNSTASTTTGTGALIVTGGVGVGGALNVGGEVVIGGNLTINGTTTTLNTNTLTVDDKNIELGSVVTKTGLVATLATGTNSVTLTTGNTSGVIPGQKLVKTSGTGVFGTGAQVGAITSATVFTVVNAAGAALNHATAGSITFSIEGASDTSANGGGITIKGTTDKTFIWNNNDTGWTANDRITAPALVIPDYIFADGDGVQINPLESVLLNSENVSLESDSGGLLLSGTLDIVSLYTKNNINIELTPHGTGITTTARPLTVTNSTASTTTGTGALVVTGGVGVGGALNVGSLDIAKNVTKIGTSKTSINALSGFSSLDKNFPMAVTSVTGNGTTTVNMEVTNSTSAFDLGFYVNIEGAVGTEQSKLNGVWKITGATGNGNQFQFQIAQSLASGTYTTNIGTVHLATFHFFGLDGDGFFTSRNGVNLGSEEALNSGTTSKIKTRAIVNSDFIDMNITNTSNLSIILSTDNLPRMTVNEFGVDVIGDLVASGSILASTLSSSLGTLTLNTGNASAINLQTNGTTRWTLTAAGILESNGAQTLRTSTGALTLATNAGNGNVILTPHGTGITTTARPLTITNATASNTTGSGALIVTGGVGVGGALNVGTTSSLGGNVTVNGNIYGNSTGIGTTKIYNNTGEDAYIELDSDNLNLSAESIIFNRDSNSIIKTISTGSGTVGNQLTIGSGSTVAGGTNIAGGNLNIRSGQSTGNAVSSIVFQTPTPGASGTTLNALADRMTINNNGVTVSRLNISDIYIQGTNLFNVNDTSFNIYIGDDQLELNTLSGTGNISLFGSPSVSGNLSVTGTTTLTGNLTYTNSANKTFGIETVFGTNIAGRNLTINSGSGTGTGAVSSLIFQTPTVGVSGTTSQTQATRMTINSTGATVVGTVTATTFSGSGSSLTSLPAGNLTGTISIDRLPTVTIAKGGTNATTTANARTNLDVSRVRNGTTRTDMSFTLDSGVLTITLN